MPSLGFGLEHIFALDEEPPATPTPTRSPVQLQLGAGLNDFFEEEDQLVYTPIKRKALGQVPATFTRELSALRLSAPRRHVQYAFDTDVSDVEESDSEISIDSLEDDTLVDESKPSTPGTNLPFTPSPGNAKSHEVLNSYDDLPASELNGTRLSSSVHVIDYEPHAHGDFAPERSRHGVISVPSSLHSREHAFARGAHLRLPDLPMPTLFRNPEGSLPTTPGSGPSGYASLVAAGPSIGDFARLFPSSPGISPLPTPIRPVLQPSPTRRELQLASLEDKLKRHTRVDVHSDNDVHIFVDMSNIHIGFIDSWKLAHKIPISQRIKAPKFSFENLARILSRNRNVKEKHLAGSVAFPATRRSNWPKHMKDAAGMGYAMKIMERVLKEKSPPKHYNTRGPGGYSSILDPVHHFATTSADDSTGDNAPLYVTGKNGEQGVDEGLHVEMLSAIIDHEPGVMVLATGDGAEAEFSEGFKAYAIKAMKNGWEIEVCAWKKTVSSAWSEPAFLAEWGDQIRIIHLDPFLDELVAEVP